MQATIGASALCQRAILAAESASHLPDRLLGAIALVESGRRDASGAVYPWPWTVNADGAGHFYDTQLEAVAAVLAFQSHGVRSIDVGCMQINLQQHPEAFGSLEQAFDPVQNARFAARFLMQLFAQTSAWPAAAAAYHSQTPELGADYARKVLAAWGLKAAAPATAVATLPAPAPAGASLAGGRVAVMLLPGSDMIRVMALPGATRP